MKEVGGASSITARSFFILTLAFSLLFGCILNANTTIGIDAFAKKNSKTSSSDRASSRGSDSGNGSRNKASDTTSDLGKQGGEPTVPLPV